MKEIEYPFVKPLESNIDSDQLDWPDWTESASKIINDLQETFKPLAHESLLLVVTTPLGSQNFTLTFLNGDLFFNLYSKSIHREQMEHSINQPVQPLQTRPEISNLEKRQTTSKVILKYRCYFSKLADQLDKLLQNKDEENLTLQLADKTEKQVTFNQCLDAIRKLKNELLFIVSYIDRELLEYSTRQDMVPAWPKWNELSEHKQKIETLLKELNSNAIREHLSAKFHDYQVSPETILGDIIGLRREANAHIFKDVTSHENEEQIICRHFEDVYHYEICPEQNQFPLEDQLVHLGFTVERAAYIAKSNEGVLNHVSVLDVAKVFVEDLFKYDLLLTDSLSNLPDWSKAHQIDYFLKNSNPQKSHLADEIVVQNFANNDSNIIKNLFSFLGDSEEPSAGGSKDFEYWYHGTDSKSAANIAKIGIRLYQGKNAKDFSDGDGFYMSDIMEEAFKLAKRRPAGGILRFKVPVEFWTDNPNGIILSFDTEDPETAVQKKWRDIIRYFRSQGEDDENNIEELVQNVPFILGPLSEDGVWNINKLADWPKPLPKTWKQLCIRQMVVCKSFNKYLDKIAFFNKIPDAR